MTQISRVLAAVDFSTPARGAFDYALALSKQHRAELVVVQAVPRRQPFSSEASERLALAAELRHRSEQEHVRFAHRVQHGDPAEVILLHARALHPDVIVLGTHQRRGIDRLRVGSVAQQVAEEAAAPVLLVPEREQTGEIKPFSDVAVAVDFGPSSAQAIEQALALASGPSDRITLLHVVPGFPSGVPPQMYRYGAAEYQSHLIADARQQLQLTVPIKRRTSAAIHTRVLVGDPATEITRAVDSIGADLLIVGVPKRGRVSRAVFGTTAGRLLRQARVPILAVPDGVAAVAQDQRTDLQLAA